MNIEDIYNEDFFSQEIDIPKVFARLLHLTVSNNMLLKTVIETQIIINKKLHTNLSSNEDRDVIDNCNDTITELNEKSQKEYLEIFQTIIKG